MVTIELRKGWLLDLVNGEDGIAVRMHNPQGGDDVENAFFEVRNDTPYGAPMLYEETSLGVPLRECGVDQDGEVVGAIVYDADGNVTNRFSWSNIVVIGRNEFTISENGELTVDGESHGWLSAIVAANKNRLVGYVGYFAPKKPDEVLVRELEELMIAELVG